MKLPGFHLPTKEDFTALWAQGTFFLDTNVMLNLHRYPERARSDFMSTLKSLSPRVRVPHHALLEYERNRPGVIADQLKKYGEVRRVVEQGMDSISEGLERLQLVKRHANIRVEAFLASLRNVTSEFRLSLEHRQKAQANVNDDDPVRDELLRAVAGQIGPPPKSQSDLDTTYAEGAKRYEAEMPPGYRDAGKTKDAPHFYYGGLRYDRRYGDLILWEQIIAECRALNLTRVAFVTDDEKEDWWWTVEADGRKTLGPRPELVEELRRRAGVDTFYMYRSEQFLRWSGKFLNRDIGPESLEQIRDVKRATGRVWNDRRERETNALISWLLEHHQGASVTASSGFPSFLLVDKLGRKAGYHAIQGGASAHLRLRDMLFRAYYELSSGRLDNLWFVVLGDSRQSPLSRRSILHLVPEVSQNVGLVFGSIVEEQGGTRFVATEILAPGELSTE